MSYPIVPEADFIRLFREIGPTQLAAKFKLNIRGVMLRRRNLERMHGISIEGPLECANPVYQTFAVEHPGRLELECRNGIIIVGSDFHYWPGPASLMHRAMVEFCKEFKPTAVIANGDVLDGSTISRHPPINWESLPTVQEEIEAAQERLGEIEKAAGRARKLHCLGNHDSRFETRLASVAPQFAKVHGVHLKDHFPLWEPCWSGWVNGHTVVKHRFKGGIHAAHNNTLWAGKSIITGHLHSAKVTPFSDYNGTRYGVDTGCIASPSARAFLYTEDNPKNWRESFACLTLKDGRLMQPELVLRWDDTHVEFRGEVIRV